MPDVTMPDWNGGSKRSGGHDTIRAEGTVLEIVSGVHAADESV